MWRHDNFSINRLNFTIMTDYTIEKKEYKGFTIEIWNDDLAESPRDWDNCATFVCEHRNYNFGDEHDIDSAVNELFGKYVTSEAIIAYFVKNRGAKITEDEDGKFYEYTNSYSWGDSTYYIDATQSNDDIAAEMADDFSTMEKLELAAASGEFVWRPISMYEHSGIRMWLGGTAGHVDARWDCSTIGFAYLEKCTADKEYIPTEEYKTWQEWAYHIMEAEMKVYDDYVSGECYGWSILDECDDVIESCGGYYGSDYEEQFEECKGIIDSYIERREKEHVERIGKIREFLLENIHVGEKFYIFGYVYSIGRDMFGNAVLERAKIVKNRILPLEQYNTKDLDRYSAETLLQCIESLKTA
ncbi:MAG: hypothetical protein ACI4SO_07565 [Muribaculaceae bacterium]